MAQGSKLPVVGLGSSRPTPWPSDIDGMVRMILRLPDGRRLTLRGLGRRANMSPEVVRRILRGLRNPLLSTGLRLAAGLEISPQRLQSYLTAVRSRPTEERRRARARTRKDWTQWLQAHPGWHADE